jgi:RNA polymerase sigma factor (sigma-70 family)
MRFERGASLGDIEAVYRTRFAEFCSVAAAILPDREAGRDAVQDAFAEAVRNRRAFRGDGSPDAWLWRMVVNSALDGRRKRWTSEPHEPEPTTHVTDDDELRAVIQQLPERQRLVVFLRYWADLDYASIADALAIAPGTVAAALHAAHGSIRNSLQEVRT